MFRWTLVLAVLGQAVLGTLAICAANLERTHWGFTPYAPIAVVWLVCLFVAVRIATDRDQ